MVMLLIVEDPVIKNNITGFRHKGIRSFMVTDPVIANRPLFPGNTSRQMAGPAFVRPDGEIKPCFPAAVVHEGCTPYAVCFPQGPPGEKTDTEASVSISVEFRKKLAVGLFGGEGFIMQRFSGRGTAFVEVDGDLKEIELKPGQQIVVDTGNVLGYESGVRMDIVSVKGMKNKLLGGEGLFNTVLYGPGKVWLQTMPVSSVARAIIPYIPTNSN